MVLSSWRFSTASTTPPVICSWLVFPPSTKRWIGICCYVLRTGNVDAKHGAVGVLKRPLPPLLRAFPGAQSRILLDAGFSGPELYAFFDAHNLEYVAGTAINAWLADLIEPLMAEVRSDFEPARQTTRR